MKKYKIQYNIGRVKYFVSTYDGKDRHADGSEFWGCKLFSNKMKMNFFISDLKKQGYICQ